MESANQEKQGGVLGHGRLRVRTLTDKLKSKVVEFCSNVKKLGEDDPRRVLHSLKVGLALTLVSLIYYYQPIYHNFGVSAMWAVMTVVVVFEFSVGATLGKGLNRGVATLLAASLGVGAHHLASLSGQIGEPILIGLFVFLQAAVSTFIRFFPNIKARYDYGLLIFILTFSFVSVSGFRQDEILELAHKRLSTVIIGGATCVIISIFICPVWAGQDLHNLLATNLDKVGDFLEGFVDEYCKTSSESTKEDEKTSFRGYEKVLNSKATEESLANFARWEPGHGRFKFRHPWKQYLQIGALTRQCAYRIEALNGNLNTHIQVSADSRSKVQEAIKTMSRESGKALKELASSVKTMTKPSSADSHIEKSKSAAKNMNSLLNSDLIWQDTKVDQLQELIQIATVASILIDIVNWVDKISDSVHQLSISANFQNLEPTVSPEKSQKPAAKSPTTHPDPHVVITVAEDGGEPNNSIQTNKIVNHDELKVPESSRNENSSCVNRCD
ncbi:aluminum-activated malate transporter 2-like [Carica papaya]|uniref:aluminum-activated malate transporter 2-like n=1 Tax=Carica papaya TaxID=3649 RepID=UPI000B8C932D|nr:aluminum-activated malate transporter 2-like [Carica papaya]